jgi:excisionase family DNA binding protein
MVNVSGDSHRSLLSISEASAFLGVSEAALRQWTDEGRIKAFITPGGHRRYSRDELNKLMATGQKSLGIKQLVTGLEDTVGAHREMDRARVEAMPWYSELSPADQEELAIAGRRFLTLVTRYVAEPARRDEVMKMAREAGAFFGDTLARHGLPLTDAVQTFIAHRDPLVRAATELMKRHEPVSERVVGAIPLVVRVMDEALVSLVSAHQQCQGKKSGGGQSI